MIKGLVIVVVPVQLQVYDRVNPHSRLVDENISTCLFCAQDERQCLVVQIVCDRLLLKIEIQPPSISFPHNLVLSSQDPNLGLRWVLLGTRQPSQCRKTGSQRSRHLFSKMTKQRSSEGRLCKETI